jgi:hypothetical protein
LGEGIRLRLLEEDKIMEYKEVQKDDFTGNKVKVLDATFEKGTPVTIGVGEDLGWRKNFQTRNEMMRYLKTGERYWYSKDWYGSEKKR